MTALEMLSIEAQQACAEGRPVPSPCVQVCLLDERTGGCEGCHRRLDEIGGWLHATEAERRAVWRRVAARAGFSWSEDA